MLLWWNGAARITARYSLGPSETVVFTSQGSESDVRDASRGESGAGNSDRSTRAAFEGPTADRSMAAAEVDAAD